MAQSKYTCEACGKQFGTLMELQEHTEQCPEARRLESSGKPKTSVAGSSKPQE